MGDEEGADKVKEDALFTNRKHYPSPLVHILDEATNPPFSIMKKEIPVGRVLNMYDAEYGTLREVEFDEPFPIVTLEEVEEDGGGTWMSTSPLELESFRRHLEAVHGRVLVGGLGLGVFPFLASKRSRVISIDIIEKEQKIIDLVFPQLYQKVSRVRKKCRVICDDIYPYLGATDFRYDFIFLDIWNVILGPVRDHDKATQAARRCLRDGGEVRIWLQELVDRVKDRLPKGPMKPLFSGPREPCMICGKTLRFDYAGLCMDCADLLDVSEASLEG